MTALLATHKLPYTDVVGTLKTRDAVADFVNWFYPMPAVPSDAKSESKAAPFAFNRNHVIVTAGAIQAVYDVLALSIENKDDVVVSPLPAYGARENRGLFD